MIDASKTHGCIIIVIVISMCSTPGTLRNTPSTPPTHGYIGIIIIVIMRSGGNIRREAVLATRAAAVP